MGRKYTWKKIPQDNSESKYIKELGCPHPDSPSYYSYLSDTKGIQHQRCAGINSSLSTRGAKSYRYIQHYSIEFRCDEAQEALCVRTPHERDKSLIVTKHVIGKCPLCNYYTNEEYYEDVERRHGRADC